MTWSVEITSGAFARDFGVVNTNAGHESQGRTTDDYGYQESAGFTSSF